MLHSRYPSGSSNRLYCETYRKVSITKSRTPKGMRRYIKIISNYIRNSILSKKIEYSQVKSLMNTQYGWGGGIRTHECSSQSAVSYRLTTPHCFIKKIAKSDDLAILTGVDNRIRTDGLQGHNLAL